MTKRKITAFLLALAIAAPITTALADDPDPSATATTGPEVTVVGKRIIGDDTYFEISLEVNGDYEDYSAVGVVLEYDPDYIVPADSWDDEATEANMDDAVSWATRRALPTLGKDTWSTHTALTYIEQNEVEDPNDSSKTIKVRGKGYLYLGAEYPGKQPNTTTESSDGDGDGDGGSGDGTATDSTTPEVDPDNKYANPVVAVRFMYAGDDANAKKTAKAKLVSEWEKTQSGGKSWQDDWFMNSYDNANAILRIAPDAISAKSPAQYGFAYYGADFSERAFMYDWPTATAAPVTPATRAPYTPPATGSAIAAENRLSADKIEIVTDEGKTAKSGGLQLSDVFAILFFDWDDTLIGTLVSGYGAKDMTTTVNNYVKEKFIHPDLRQPKEEDLTSTKRKDNYRGEYPYSGPTGSNAPMTDSDECITNGGDYPLTNKLDYCFAGKDFNKDAPFAGGWTQFVLTEPDYSDTTKYPGKKVDIMPKSQANTWTALSTISKFTKAPKLDDNGNILTSDENGDPYPIATVPDMVSFDFADLETMTKEDLEASDGNLYVKAVYTPGEYLDIKYGSGTTPNALYSIYGDTSYDVISSESAAGTVYGISYQYRRVNEQGCGVTRVREPKVRVDLTQEGASGTTIQSVDIENKDIMNVQLTPSYQVKTMNVQLRNIYDSSIINGATISSQIKFDKEAKDFQGFVFKATWKVLTEQLSNLSAGTATTIPMSFYGFQHIDLRRQASPVTNNGFTNQTLVNQKVTYFRTFMTRAKQALGADAANKITYYQLQYALCTNNYVAPDVAKANCQRLYSWTKDLGDWPE